MPHPQTKNPDLPEDICKIICKMTEKSPEKRYQSAEKLLIDLEALRLAHASDDPTQTSSSIGGRNRLIPIVAVSIILGVITLIVADKLGSV